MNDILQSIRSLEDRIRELENKRIPFYPKNYMRNPNFEIAQAGTSFTNPANAIWTLDGYRVLRSDDGAVNVLQTADAPTVSDAGSYSRYCIHADVTTIDASIGAGQFYGIMTKIEGNDISDVGFGQSGLRYMTLSFWAKHTKTGVYCVSLRNNDANRSYIAEYTINSSDTWEYKKITFLVDTTGTWEYGVSPGLQISFIMASGSTYNTTAGSWQNGNFLASSNQVNALDSASNNFKIARVKLQRGTIATDFDFPLYGQALADCMRYRIRLDSVDDLYQSFGVGYCASTTQARVTLYPPVQMRADPTFTFSAQNVWDVQIAGNNILSTGIADDRSSRSALKFIVTVAGGLTAGQACTLLSMNTNSAYIIASAEM